MNAGAFRWSSAANARRSRRDFISRNLRRIARAGLPLRAPRNSASSIARPYQDPSGRRRTDKQKQTAAVGAIAGTSLVNLQGPKDFNCHSSPSALSTNLSTKISGFKLVRHEPIANAISLDESEACQFNKLQGLWRTHCELLAGLFWRRECPLRPCLTLSRLIAQSSISPLKIH